MIRLSCLLATVAAAVSTATATADPPDQTVSWLPAGYSSDACNGIDSLTALYAVNCGPNDLPGGPTSAIYQLFGDDESLQKAFSIAFEGVEWVPMTCPGAQSSEPLVLKRSDGTTVGYASCGRARTFRTDKDCGVAWTRTADRFFGVSWVGYQGQTCPTSLVDWVKSQAG